MDQSAVFCHSYGIFYCAVSINWMWYDSIKKPHIGLSFSIESMSGY